MPLSANTNPVNVTITVGAKYAISADGGSVSVESIVQEGSGGDFVNNEGTVAAGERMFYQGRADLLAITPSAAGVFWTVTKVSS